MKAILSAAFLFTWLISGCASFGRGVAEVLIKPSETDRGECLVFSGGFEGVNDMFKRNGGRVRIIMIHGIGKKSPGYSTAFVEKLAFKLGFDTISRSHKDIELSSPRYPSETIGHLRIYDLRNENGSKELLFYEYTWADITEDAKATLRFDTNDSNASRRTELSRSIKNFLNETGSDAVIYIGNQDIRKRIHEGTFQSFCWMTEDSWKKIPDGVRKACSYRDMAKRPRMNDTVIITHSLGSQISIDTLQAIVSGDLKAADGEQLPKQSGENSQNSSVTIFMLANQLPAIALGKEVPAISAKISEYCTEGAARYEERFINRTNIIAFSDPNDVLSYAIPAKFENIYLDSRLCPDITNVFVNVAPLSNLFGKPMANPFEAHSNYQKDDRVIDLIINGTEGKRGNTARNNDCRWIKTVNE